MKNTVLFRSLAFLVVFLFAQVEIIAQGDGPAQKMQSPLVRRAEVKKKLLSALSAQKFGFLKKETQDSGLSADQSALKYLVGVRAAKKARLSGVKSFKKS